MRILSKNITPTMVAMLAVMAIGFVVLMYFALSNKPATDPECTVEYVKANGSTDCENIMKASDEQESENTNNYYN